MISKNQRLSKNRVEFLLKKGLKSSNNFFGGRFLPNNLLTNRFSVVVSKKISKSAVERNLIRRQAYTILSKFNSTGSNCHDLVLIVREAFTKLDFQNKQYKVEEFLLSLIKNQ